MPAFNYRNLIHQIPPHIWHFYFQSNGLPWPEGLEPEAPDDGWAALLQATLDDLPEDQQRPVFRDLRRVHGLGNRRGVDALRNTVPADFPMLDDFAHHTSDAERALWALANWPDLFERAEAFRHADALLGHRTWQRLHVAAPLTLYTAAPDLDALSQALSRAFTPRKSRPRACEVDCLTRHLDGAVQLDLRVEDDAQRQHEFSSDDRTVWRDVRPPVYLTVVIYPDHGMLDLLVPGGAVARRKVVKAIGQHVLHQHIEPLERPVPVFLLNRLRDGAQLPADSALDLLAHGVGALRLAECKVRSLVPPRCDYLIKPPGEKAAPDVSACLRAHHAMALVGANFTLVEAVLSLYFYPPAGAKKGRPPLHLNVRPHGISHLNELSEADAHLATALLTALGVAPTVPAATVVAAAEPLA